MESADDLGMEPPVRPLPHPRSWLADPDHRPDPFGREARTGRPEWKEPANATEGALIAAAQNQHHLSRQIRQYRDRANTTTEAIAHQIGRSTDYLRRILRGTAHPELTDLHLIAATIDSHVAAVIRVGPVPDPPASATSRRPND